MHRYIKILLALLFLNSSLLAQDLSDFKTPKKFIKFVNKEGSYDIDSKVQYNGESLLLYVNNKLEVILTDLLFIRNQVTEGVNCKAYHATCTTDKARYTVLVAEKSQFFFVKMNGDEFVFLTNKGVKYE